MKNHDGQPKHQGCKPGVAHPHRFYCPIEIQMVAEREQDAIIKDVIQELGNGGLERVRAIILARRKLGEANPWMFQPSVAPTVTYAFSVPANKGDKVGVHVSLNAGDKCNFFLGPVEAAKTIKAMTDSLDAVLDKHDSMEFVTHVRGLMKGN